MGLFSTELILSRAQQGRCLKGNEELSADEFLFCPRCCSSLYKTGFPTQDKTLVDALISSLLEQSRAIRRALTEDADFSRRLKGFFRLLLKKGSDSLESFAHAFMFLYWEQPLFPDKDRSPSGELFWLAKGAPKGTSFREGAEPNHRAMERLSQAGVEVDLAAIDAERHILWLVEIKRAELDDRSVGQMIRYFDRAAHCLTSREFRSADISIIRPTLILERADPKHWVTIPLHFRELLEIYEFKNPTQTGGDFVLSCARKRLLSTERRD
jgi:hypothetical protein